MRRAAAAVLALVALFALVCPTLARALAGLDATTQDVLLGASAPSWRHPFGTDVLGRDLLVRTMDGGAIALRVGLAATAIALVIGVAWGAVAGYAGGKLDELLMRAVDVIDALPSVVFVIVVMALV